jgi:REP element-mobilizing transposase RayT
MTDDPIAYFITWTTYGTWLPGDQRGWVERGSWEPQLPNLYRERHARSMMTEDAVVLTSEQRPVVDQVIVEHCRIRNWFLHARNVRTNHVHVVVSAMVDPKVVREQFKAWASRRLSDAAGITRESVRTVENAGGLKRATLSYCDARNTSHRPFITCWKCSDRDW